MIAKKEWFKPRIFGWGLRPTSWEGWVYILIALLLFFGAMNLPVSGFAKAIMTAAVIIVFVVDVMIAMFEVYGGLSDEEKNRQHIIEAAASYAAVGAIFIVVIFRAIVNKTLDIGALFILGAMAVAKAITSFYLWKKEIENK